MVRPNQPSVDREWLTVDEAKQRTGVAKTEIYLALRAGELVGSQRGSRKRWRIHIDDLDRWMRHTPTPASA